MPKYESRSIRGSDPHILPMPFWTEATPTEDLANLLDSRPDTVITFRTDLGDGEYEYTEWRLMPRDEDLLNEMRSSLHLFSSASITEKAERIYDLLKTRDLVP